MFFARRIKCPIYINTGFIDTTCCPSSVYAAFNQIPAGTEKYMQTTPAGGHGSAKHTQGFAALTEYLKKIANKDKAK
ncbi:MAG: acetylxylan esterase, partial [Lentisphaeria bacterium]|nr:acetylxylan esterase [Lentisphaeria bacterium]